MLSGRIRCIGICTFQGPGSLPMQPTGELVIEGSVIYSALLGITGGYVIVMDGANLNFTVRQNIPMVINSPCSIGAANVIFDTGVVNFLQKVFMQAGASANFMNTMACDRRTIFAPNTSLSVLPAFCQCHQCYLPVCFGRVSSDPTACSGNGQCNTLNKCVCKLGYNDPTGRCGVDNGKCACKDGYIGSQCEIVICGGIWSNDPTVCSSRGLCNRPNQCDCPPGFIGSFCQFPVCYGLSLESGSKQCSGRGQCNSQIRVFVMRVMWGLDVRIFNVLGNHPVILEFATVESEIAPRQTPVFVMQKSGLVLLVTWRFAVQIKQKCAVGQGLVQSHPFVSVTTCIVGRIVNVGGHSLDRNVNLVITSHLFYFGYSFHCISLAPLSYNGMMHAWSDKSIGSFENSYLHNRNHTVSRPTGSCKNLCCNKIHSSGEKRQMSNLNVTHALLHGTSSVRCTQPSLQRI
jgi:hypothetical protein